VAKGGKKDAKKPLGHYDYPCAVKVQYLDPIAPTVAEHKQCPALGVFTQLHLSGVPQPVEVHPQIAGRNRHEYFEVSMEA
jgi:hypothetical protein